MSLRLNQILGGADIRSPIFYDSNDTSYYVDPASTSIMQYVRAANFYDGTGTYNVNLGSGNSEGRGLVAGYSGGSYGGIGYNVRHTTTGGSWIAPSTDTSTYLLFSNGIYFYYAAGGAAGRTLSYSTIGSLTSAGIFTVSGDVRAPIFYDSNNTAYYVDPASTGYSAYFAGAIQATKIGIEDAGLDCYMEITDANPVIYGVTYGGEFIFYGDKSTPASFLYYGGATVTYTLQANSSLRAPIFYDSNDTTYYTDPASFSLISSLGIGGLTSSNNVQMYDSYVDASSSYLQSPPLIIRKDSSATGAIDQAPVGLFIYNLNGTNNTWTKLSMGSREAAGAGNTVSIAGLAAQKTAGTANAWATGNLHFWTKAGGTQITNMVAYSAGYVQSDYSFRSPIFYDSNNTAYYLDPASTSNLVGLTVANTITGSISGNSATTTLATKATRANGNFYIDDNYGNTVVGLYSATRLQGVFAMGDSYKLTADGTGVGTLYGLAWSHPNFGGVAANLADHGLLILQNGVFKGAWGGGSLRTPGDVRGTLFYDWDNTAYYCDPASTSNLNAITAAGNVTAAQYYTGGWFRNNGSGNGLYNESTTQHFYSDDVSYWNVASSSSAQGIRFRTGGHGGTVRGYVYANNGNDVGFLNNGGNWRARIVGGDYFLADGSSIRGQIFYDSNDTNYYCDPNSSSVLSSVTANAYYPRAAVTESDIYAQSLSINAYHHGDSLTYDTFQFNAASAYETRATVGASFVSGTVETSIFKGDRFGGMSIANGVYQVRWTWNNTIGYKFFKTLYLGNSTNGNSFTVTIEASGNGSTWTTIATSTAMSNWPGHSWYNYAWNNNAYQGYIRLTITPSWSTVYGIDIYSMRYFCSYSLDAGSRLYDWDYSKNVTFAAAVSSPIFYDSNNTGYYVNPASQSKLNNLLIDTGSSNTSMTIVGSNQPSIFLKTTDNERNIEIFNSYGNFGIYRINAPSNYIIYHVDNGASSYTYFQLEGTARLTINSSGSTATTSVRSPIFYDSDNTAYFIDGAGTSNILGLTVNNTITGSVSGNAGTATTLQTARNINGTSFNGSANITTASWGTARTITIGATGKSVDGSANASWSLAEITGSQTANTFLAAPNGSAGNPTFRAIVAADIPTLNQNTTGTAANVTGTVAIANGGTGATTAANAATNLGLGTGNTPKFLNVFGERASVTASASTTVNTQFNVTELTMSASITTLTLSNIQANTIVHMWTIVTLGNGTGYSITWPAAIKWPGGTAPTITSTNAKRDIYQFVTYDGGTNIYAIIVGQNL